eukprot:m.101432 g.101432  ORF g.101432 m.101432 type:complete len:839 (+) comp14089_c0_seq7:137-2653(+)
MDDDDNGVPPPPQYPPTPKYSVKSFKFDDGETDDDEDANPHSREPSRYGRHRSRRSRKSNGQRNPGEVMEDIYAQLPSRRADALTFAEAALHGGNLTASLIEDFIRDEEDGRDFDQQRRVSRHQFGRNTRHDSRHATLHRTGSNLLRIGNEEEQLAADEITESQHIIKTLKLHVAPLAQKVEIAREEHMVVSEARKKLNCFQLWYAEFTMGNKRRLRALYEFIFERRIWDAAIKNLAGKHGAAVGMYFTFLRWCLFLNLMLAILWIAFVVIPQALIHGFGVPSQLRPPVARASSLGAELVGLFTGTASLSYSAYFIGAYFIPYQAGSYVNPVVTSYDVPLAYLLTAGFYLTLAFALIFRRVYKAVYLNTTVTEEGGQFFAELLFCSYDHSLTDAHAISLKRIGIAQLIRATLTEAKAKEEQSKISLRSIYARRALINLVVIVILALSLYIVQLAVTNFSDNTDISYFIPSLILAVFNFALPLAFRMLSVFESWTTDLFVIQITVVRAMIMRVAGLFVFFYTIFQKRTAAMCWESFVGQYVYSLFLIIMLFEMMSSFLQHPIWRFFARTSTWFLKNFGEARFDTVSATVELVYSQTLVLFGTFFCPLLPLLGILKIGLLFTIKNLMTLHFCQPPIRAFRARHSFTALFYSVLLFMLFVVAFPLGYAITRLPTSGAYMSTSDNDQFITNSTLRSTVSCSQSNATCLDCITASSTQLAQTICWAPQNSKHFPNGASVTLSALCAACPSGCGPFRNQASIYQTAITEFHRWDTTAQQAINYIATPAFVGLVLLLLIIMYFYQQARSAARQRLCERMRLERDMERMDKIWILQKYSITLDGAP